MWRCTSPFCSKKLKHLKSGVTIKTLRLLGYHLQENAP